MYILNKALEYIFLPCCGVCNKIGEGYLCKKCEKELEKYVINLKQTICFQETDNNIRKRVKQKSIINTEKHEKFHIFKYDSLIRNLIIQYKFYDKSYLYKTFCEFIVKNKKAFDFIKSYDIIIPVPIHKKRMRERGYNQSELIAYELAKRVKIKCYRDILIKVRNNKPQSTLTKKMRKENTKNVYKIIKKEKIINKKILLFDDIYTTGATANSCIQELKGEKIRQIGLLTLAKD